MTEPDTWLARRIFGCARDAPDRIALVCGDRASTYGEFVGTARSVAARMTTVSRDGYRLTGVLGKDGFSTYCGILAGYLAGGWVPLNTALPTRRLGEIVAIAGFGNLVVCPDALHLLPDILTGMPAGSNVAGPEIEDFSDAVAAFPEMRFWNRDALLEPAPPAAPPPRPLAYLYFTSGSTGMPKGIPITRENLDCYIRRIDAHFRYGPDDRVFQASPLSFDMAVHNMMVAWYSGARLIALPLDRTTDALEIAAAAGVTAWLSTPSLVSFLNRLGADKAGTLKDLRLALFCGEALPVSVAELIASFAPAAEIHNLYGPTEATVAISGYHWRPEEGCIFERGLVPIGKGFEETDLGLFDPENCAAIEGSGKGEVWLRGGQVAEGYWRDEEQTRRAFIKDRDGTHWYRTGDFARRDADEVFHFLGRTDSQVKVHGYRIELGEIEAAIRAATGRDGVLVLPWPPAPAVADRLVAVVETTDPLDVRQLRHELRQQLPNYMIPARVMILPNLPRNLNDKHDRAAVAAILSETFSR